MTKPQTQKTTFKRDFEMRYGVSPETKPLGRNTDATEPNTRGAHRTLLTASDHKHEAGAFGVCRRCGLEKHQHQAPTVTPPGKHTPEPWIQDPTSER